MVDSFYCPFCGYPLEHDGGGWWWCTICLDSYHETAGVLACVTPLPPVKAQEAVPVRVQAVRLGRRGDSL